MLSRKLRSQSKVNALDLCPFATSFPVPSRLDDDVWDDLLNFIEEKRVIPIIGSELLKVETDSGPRLLYDWLAEKLAAKLDYQSMGYFCSLVA